MVVVATVAMEPFPAPVVWAIRIAMVALVVLVVYQFARQIRR